jgi:two-component system chemotaxis response regulator CheY
MATSAPTSMDHEQERCPRRRILVVEDEPHLSQLVTDILEAEGYVVIAVGTGGEAEAVLERVKPDLVLLDIMLPDADGLILCSQIQARWPAPVIMVSATKRERDRILSLRLGADDFIAKPFDLEELKVRLRAGQRIIGLQQELERRALQDSLTGVLNRGAINQALDIELRRRSRTQLPAAVVMVDVDHFKQVNDTHGHAVGDDVLKEVARRMAAALRPYDALGRFGGEEFLIVLPDCSPASACEVAERVRSAVAASPAAVSGTGSGVAVAVTVSLGVACIESHSQETGHSLMNRADAAMYRAKTTGRNRVVMAQGRQAVSAVSLPASATAEKPHA